MNNTTKFGKVATLLTGALVTAGIGSMLGASVTSLALHIVAIVMSFVFIFGMAFTARRDNPGVAIACLLGMAGCVGFYSGPMLAMATAVLGPSVMTAIFLGSGGIMGICALIAVFSGINFRPLEKYLLIALLALVVVGIVSIFTGMSFGVELIYCIAGIVIFVGYFLVDFYRLKHDADDSWGSAVLATANLFLDLWNVILFIIRLALLLSGKKDD